MMLLVADNIAVLFAPQQDVTQLFADKSAVLMWRGLLQERSQRCDLSQH